MVAVVVPYQGTPTDGIFEIAPAISKADVFFLMDATASMPGALGSLSSSLSATATRSSGRERFASSSLPQTELARGGAGRRRSSSRAGNGIEMDIIE
jgi:hypothetical protein